METVINNQLPLDLDEGKRKREAELLQKPKPKKANEESSEVTTRKKPGRKRLEVTESNTKKEKNRVAQRAWRERKEKYVMELESKIADLENAKNKSENEKQQLKLIIEKLRSENTYLKNATSFIFTPTKETQMFMQQNKLKILHQKKQNNQPSTVNNNVPIATQPSPVNPELISNNVIYDNTNNESVPSLTASTIDENLLSETNPEVLNELYKLLNMQNQENGLSNINNQDGSPFNSTLMTPDSLMNGATSPLNQDLVPPPNTANSMYNMLSPLQKDDIIIPNDYDLNSAVPNGTTDPNLLLLMNDQNPNKDLTQALLNQQQQLNAINPSLVSASSSSSGLPNTVSATIPSPAIDQNSLLTMSMLGNIPQTYNNLSQPALSPAMQSINGSLYPLDPIQLSNTAVPTSNDLNKPITVNGNMSWRSETTKEKSQPITDELFNNMIQMLHQQQQGNLDGYDEDDQLIQQINQSAREMYTNPITGMPSPSSTLNYSKENPTTPDALATMGAPYTPEDLDTESNKSGEYAVPRNVTSRGIPDFEEDSDNSIEIRSREIPMEVTSREIPMEVTSREVKLEDKRSNSTHSTLQFPAEQKPTKLNIPYSVFPRVTQETVDNFISEAKLSEEELECLCSELKNKATCKEKLKYISKNVEIDGWTMENWKKGRIKKLEQEKAKKEAEKEEEKKEEVKNDIKEETESPSSELKIE